LNPNQAIYPPGIQQLSSLTVPPGDYVVTAHVEVNPESSGSVICKLADHEVPASTTFTDGALDSGVVLQNLGQTPEITTLETAMPLTAVAAEPSGATLYVSCDGGGQSWSAAATITAVAVGALN
jgi:hypothetical protein